jgi:hypothetical protein
MKILMENNNYFMYADYDWEDGSKMWTPHYSPAKEFAKKMTRVEAERWFDMFKDREFIHEGKTYIRRCVALGLIVNKGEVNNANVYE